MPLTIKDLLGGIKAKESGNVILEYALSFLDDLLLLAEQSQTEQAQFYIAVGCRTLLDMEPVLRKSVNESPTQWDDKILDEVMEAAREIVPGYVPVPYPG